MTEVAHMTRIVGMAHNGSSSLHIILEDSTDEGNTTSSGGRTSGFPISRECNVVTLTVPITTTPPSEGAPTLLAIAAIPLQTSVPQLETPQVTELLITDLFEWVVMTFGLKNTSATYQRAMNLIFHDLLGIIIEVYIDDVVVKSESMDGHLADLHLALERMRQYGLKMNPLKCVFGVSASKFLRFIIHEHGIEIDPTKIESINKVQPPRCKNDMQKLLGKVNYLR
jgi:hypothetical protein